MAENRTEAPKGVTPLVQQIAHIDEQIKHLQGQRDSLVAVIREMLPTPGKYQAGDLGVSIRPGARRLDAKRFTQAFPPETYPDLYKVAPDTTAARNELGANRLDEFYGAANQNTVVIG